VSIVTSKKSDMCYCPGCSHGMVLEILGKAIDRLARPAHQVCVVSDIGCIGTADRYFASHTFHGLHGRSICYAEGIKRARPELTVVVLIGDGGCGIGTAHLVHAARRSADIKIVVCNNFNFGMTGGQHSSTTPCDARTTTTPGGATDYPFDICATVAANGASFVARQDVFDRELVDRLEAMLRTPGFGLVDIWELCTAYFVPANKLNRGSLLELSDRLGMPFGLFQNRHLPKPPSVSEQSSSTATRRTKRRLAPTGLDLPWPVRREICVAGSAGQRIRSALGVVGDLAVASGLFAAQQDDFPITVRKGFSVSSLIVAPEPVLYTGVDDPNLVILISRDGAERFGDLSSLSPESLVVAEAEVTLGPTPARVIRVPSAAFAKTVSRESAALAFVAYSVVAAGMITSDNLVASSEAVLTGPYRDVNLGAIRAGPAALERVPAAPSPQIVQGVES
jgi:2-oxoglutarate/2-oxoacid ferredoxin oxidoreductase subunit beta